MTYMSDYMRWWFDGLNSGNAIFIRSFRTITMTKLENVNPLLTNRDDRDVFFEEASSCRKVQRYRVLWSAQLEIAQPQSCCFAIHQLKPLFSPGNPLRCVLLRKRLCSRHQRLFPIEYHDTGRLLCLFDLQHEKWERKSLWRSTLGRMCPHRVA